MGRELSTDRPRPAGRARPRGGPPRRLRPRHGRPAVPRVRVPDADRAAAADGRRVRGAAVGERSATVAESGYVPAARVAGRPDGWGPRPRPPRPARERRAPAPPRLRRGGAVRAAGRRGRRRHDGGDGRSRPPAAFEPAGDLPTRAGRRDRRSRAGSRSAAGRHRRPRAWLAAQPAVGVALVADDPRPRRGDAARPRGRRDGRPGRRGRGRARPSDALRHLVERLGMPLVGHEVKPLLVARFADDPTAPADAGRLRHPDRRLHPQRGAAQPDDRRRRRRAARPDPAAAPTELPADGPGRASRRSSAIAVREPLETTARRGERSTGCSARSSCR